MEETPVAWFTRGDYIDFKAALLDGDRLPPTDPEWLWQEFRKEEALIFAGREPLRIQLNLEEVRQLCDRSGVPFNLAACDRLAELKASTLFNAGAPCLSE